MCVCLFFFFKQKTAYELRISDWSSDVCSSDLAAQLLIHPLPRRVRSAPRRLFQSRARGTTMSGLLSFFARGAEAPSITDQAEIDRLYRRHRFRVMVAITLGYGLIYTCRLPLAVVKKPLIDQGIFTPVTLGSTRTAPLYT